MALPLIDGVLKLPLAKQVARKAANWVDLQWTLIDTDLKLVAPRARGKLLDVGCGDKPYATIFAPFVEQYVGVEHEATFALTHAAKGRSAPDFYYDGTRLPFEDGSFDTVLNVQVLEHTPEPQALVFEMARVLAPGGLLIVNVPFSFRLHEEPHDYFRYSPHGLRHMTERAGLKVLEIVPQGNLWSLLGHKLNSYLAFKVARMGSVTQALGKSAQEATSQRPARLWTLPAVLPMIASISTAARVLDRMLPDETEALSFRMLAERPRVGASPS
jgi:SAM-dependent methyltransferase